ncbi:helix-turn-helix domain-containing protein [Rhizobium sp. FKY42]|uniref:helix-turn-helix domain-containing protein n=1 Tax=Rhizobium sp. FKY42 TaxID=2562310 RepID=UPI0010BFA1E1|nr:helix-turn-helix domain-containing protein [Rhizobium sp. FKY42]
MRQTVAHADQVYASAQSTAAGSTVVASWRRCMTMHKLAPEQARLPDRLTDVEFRRARDRASSLVESSTDEIDRLFHTVGKAGCCLLLTDQDGVALERRGTRGDDKDFHQLGLWTGSIWSEASVGTNGIGTALAEERSVAIIRDQHFLSSNIALSCTTSPIRDHLGRLCGALDVSTCREDMDAITLSILQQTVRDSAMRIELNLFGRAYAGARFIMVPTETGATSALLAVDRNDLVLGATRSARAVLRLTDERISAGVPAADLLQDGSGPDNEDLQQAERAALKRALSRASGNVSQAAISLGMSRATLHRKMKKLNLN